MDHCNYRLQFITHCSERYSYVESARLALEGGCRWIQLRMKDAAEDELEKTACIVQKMCRDYGATFIIDDNVMLAKKINADGVHLGKNDMPIAQAREILGDEFIIGGTVNSFEDILQHLQGVVPDYFGCGPFRFTSTKKNLSPILGSDGYRGILKKMEEYKAIQGCYIDVPLIAIGGICKEDIPELLRCGVDGIALSGTVLRAETPVQEMAEIVEIMNI